MIYVAAFALLLFWAFFVQADTRRVDGTSMLPTLEGGDLVVIQSVPINQIHVGDIIVYNGLCSALGESVVHRVVNITAQGLITKGDNNARTDQEFRIAISPITAQCLEGKAVFIIPYVELLAYYVDQNGLPQWFNYIPSIFILIIVIISVLGDEEKDESKGSAGAEPGEPAGTRDSVGGTSTVRMRRLTVEVAVANAVLLILAYFVYTDVLWRIGCALGQGLNCSVRSAPSFSYSLLTQFFSMRNGAMLLTSPPTLDWIQVFVAILLVVDIWYLLRARAKRKPRPPSTTTQGVNLTPHPSQ